MHQLPKISVIFNICYKLTGNIFTINKFFLDFIFFSIVLADLLNTEPSKFFFYIFFPGTLQGVIRNLEC